MDGNRLLTLLGHPHSDPDVRATLEALRIGRDPEVLHNDDDDMMPQTQDFFGNLHLGIEFGFEDEASFRGLHPDEIGKGPMLMTHIYFFVDHDGTTPFEGTLPFGISAEDTNEEVRARMASIEPNRRSYIRDVWDHSKYRVIASYTEDLKLGFLVVMTPPKTVAVDPEDVARLPSSGRIFGFLGVDIDDRELQMALRSLQFADALTEIGDGLRASLASQYGLTLDFRRDLSAPGLLLHSVTFERDDAANNPRWPLELPHGIDFDMSPALLFERLGLPVGKFEDEFTGRANWLYATHELRVVYSTMDNYILEVEFRKLDVEEREN